MSSVTRTAGPPSSEVGTSSGPTTQPKARSTKGSRVNTTPAQGGSAGTQFLRRDEGRVAYEVSGEGPLVVCVPGMGELRSVYRYTVPALVANGFRVASMDLRGHGDSDASFSSYDDPAAASDIGALIGHLGGPAVIVGNSMGGAAAVMVAAASPELVTGLVLVGPVVREQPTGALTSLLMRLLMGGPWARAAARVWRGNAYIKSKLKLSSFAARSSSTAACPLPLAAWYACRRVRSPDRIKFAPVLSAAAPAIAFGNAAGSAYGGKPATSRLLYRMRPRRGCR